MAITYIMVKKIISTFIHLLDKETIFIHMHAFSSKFGDFNHNYSKNEKKLAKKEYFLSTKMKELL